MNSQSKQQYYCPMHCEGNKTYDKSGDCPVCGMNLVPLVARVVRNGVDVEMKAEKVDSDFLLILTADD
ncbi:MAG: hypothetical protein KFF49_02910 [Bacteroidales bacterium]|nr:hypothetical protein [Bacteroidales bacterium]